MSAPYDPPPSWDRAPGGEEVPPAPPPPDFRNGPRWEERARLGFFSAWFGTIGDVILHPELTFRQMRPDGGLGNPLGFYVLTMWTLQAIGFVMMAPMMMMAHSVPALAGGQSGGMLPSLFAGSMSVGLQFFMLIIAPVFIAAEVFVAAGIAHVCLLLFGGDRRGFEATFRAFAYGRGSVAVIGLIPLCGGIVAGVMAIIYIILGLTHLHETDSWRALLAVLLPSILAIGCGCAVLTLSMGAALQRPEFHQLLQQLQQLGQ